MLRKIADIKPPCRHSDHYPPSHVVLQPGVYEHTCAGCGKKTVLTVAGSFFSTTTSPNIGAESTVPAPKIWFGI